MRFQSTSNNFLPRMCDFPHRYRNVCIGAFECVDIARQGDARTRQRQSCPRKPAGRRVALYSFSPSLGVVHLTHLPLPPRPCYSSAFLGISRHSRHLVGILGTSAFSALLGTFSTAASEGRPTVVAETVAVAVWNPLVLLLFLPRLLLLPHALPVPPLLPPTLSTATAWAPPSRSSAAPSSAPPLHIICRTSPSRTSPSAPVAPRGR